MNEEKEKIKTNLNAALNSLEKIEIPNFPHETHIYNIQRNDDEKKTGNCVITITGAHGVVGDFIDCVMKEAGNLLMKKIDEKYDFGDRYTIIKEFDSTKKDYWP